jgi:hypothetical protein
MSYDADVTLYSIGAIAQDTFHTWYSGKCPGCGSRQWVDKETVNKFGWDCEGENNAGGGCGGKYGLGDYVKVCHKNKV